ncbi:MAG: hypothetical protein P8180_16345 [Gammaproteobacteria bacterium]
MSRRQQQDGLGGAAAILQRFAGQGQSAGKVGVRALEQRRLRQPQVVAEGVVVPVQRHQQSRTVPIDHQPQTFPPQLRQQVQQLQTGALQGIGLTAVGMTFDIQVQYHHHIHAMDGGPGRTGESAGIQRLPGTGGGACQQDPGEQTGGLAAAARGRLALPYRPRQQLGVGIALGL